MAGKIQDSVSNFGCDGCGQTFNKSQMEMVGSQQLCPEDARLARGDEKQTHAATLFRQFKERVLAEAQAAVATAERELTEAQDAEAKAFGWQEEVRVPEVQPVLTPAEATEGAAAEEATTEGAEPVE